MKTTIATLLLIIGMALIMGSRFVGNVVDTEDEWSSEQLAEYERLAASVHTPATDRKTLENRDKLAAMQQQLIDLRNAAAARKMRVYWSGIATCLIGFGVAIWAQATKTREA